MKVRSFAEARAEYELIADAFGEVFGDKNLQPFLAPGRGALGVCDGNKGVQWDARVECEAGDWKPALFGINLLGLVYDGWPIQRLIQRELEEPRVFDAIAKVQKPEDIWVLWYRDAWRLGQQGQVVPGRPRYYLERFLLPALPRSGTITEPAKTYLTDLNGPDWTRTLREALQCFDAFGEPVRSQITFYDRRTGRVETGPRSGFYRMTPHLKFRRVLWQCAPISRDERVEAVRHARRQLQPLYDFVRSRSARWKAG